MEPLGHACFCLINDDGIKQHVEEMDGYGFGAWLANMAFAEGAHASMFD
jgi:hypothetical protein